MNLNTRRWTAWAQDTAERAMKTLVQTVLLFALGALTDLTTAIEANPGDYLPTEALIAVPIVMSALSVVTSWLSKNTGSPNSARFGG